MTENKLENNQLQEQNLEEVVGGRGVVRTDDGYLIYRCYNCGNKLKIKEDDYGMHYCSCGFSFNLLM